MAVLKTGRRFAVGDRVVGHAWAPIEYRLQKGVISQVRHFSPPPGHKTYEVRWHIRGELIINWHNEEELCPLREDDDDTGN